MKKSPVSPKKHLGQHFLTDFSIARRIADTLSLKNYQKILEIGPGTGVLTQFLLEKEIETFVIEIDTESVNYLQENFSLLKNHIIAEDFLKFDITTFFSKTPFAIIGNFPYNISSQIVFKLIEIRAFVPEFAGMFQREVAERICEAPGSKAYGILSVLTQAFYKAEYLFTVNENVFNPPPKVKSGVIRLTRKENYTLPCDEKLFFSIVKTAFGQRRKTLRNSLKSFLDSKGALKENVIFDKRPEALSVGEFISLTQMLS